jgi:hypothetical protein
LGPLGFFIVDAFLFATTFPSFGDAAQVSGQAPAFSRRVTRPSYDHIAPPRGRIPANGGDGGAAGGARGLRDPFRPALRSAGLHAHGPPPVTRGDRFGACAPNDVGRSASRRSTLVTALGQPALETPPGEGLASGYTILGLLSNLFV